MSGIINCIETNRTIRTEPNPIQSREGSRQSYEQDEAKRLQRQT